MNALSRLAQIFRAPAPSKPAAPAGGVEAFTFGDPTPVLDGGEILDYLECWFNGRWYEPPINLDGLARSTRASVYLQSGLTFKRNMLSRTFIPHRLLDREAFEQFALDWLWCGNAYLERRRNRLGGTLSLQPALAKYMRRGQDLDRYFMVRGWQDEHEFEAGTICHIREADINQEVYGLPEWLAALQSALLNESATLFRRRYYLNGSHAGFILYMSDAAQNEKDVNALREALRSAKGPGNFRNLFLYSPSGKKDGIQVIPVSEVAAKDEFGNIKNITRDDMLAGLRIPPQLMGVVPQNAGGFGSVKDAALVYAANELEPIQARMLAVNEWVGEEVIRFRPYELAAQA
ncbi:Phage portal protein [Azotobacter vinelandii CA]|uniref:Phage portal protein n=2 Tax=Azotobacter vinelandii TaxID=354 RepID=C1DS31_AZOVD|nr:phage portal protein [Azotobacter vinelandii]ACO79906.1 Phage portal protein [Azotobacter vinelandii DJ]AGK14546.1 Phage portal protein [Azotobacter vinelandii CA]AGK21583.1 Phage portal protein [Azotobacter vinelandii CA6]SFX44937.1 phage portal protein, PBSX family [Azotobacter vinelandii]GLK62284.1 portal protein [Azotobacter vinelandii]